MGWTGQEHDPNKTVFEQFCELEELQPSDIEIWRLKDDGEDIAIHFAMRTPSGELFTAICYTQIMYAPKERGSSWKEVSPSEEGAIPWFSTKVIDMSMGFCEPLHPHVQKYYDEHKKETTP